MRPGAFSQREYINIVILQCSGVLYRSLISHSYRYDRYDRFYHYWPPYLSQCVGKYSR